VSEHAGNCGYVQKGVPCDCGLWEQSATLFKYQQRIAQLEALVRRFVAFDPYPDSALTKDARAALAPKEPT